MPWFGPRRSSLALLVAAIFVAGTGAATAQSDTAPPELVAFDFTPKTVDVSNGPASVTITTSVTDATGAVAPYITTKHASGQSAGFGQMSLTSGTTQNGTFTRVATIPQGAASGDWQVSLYPLEDTLGNTNNTFGPPAGYPKTLTVSSSGASTGTSSPSPSSTTAEGSCDSHYPDFCLPTSPDVDCSDAVVAGRKNFTALSPDPHRLDSDGNGVACETASASPTAGPSTNPSASPSTGPTTSPAPENDVPSVSVNPFVVKFGQTANVTITGTPGATVDLYIRKYLGDFIKIRDGLVLDSSGRTTVATRPDMNLRFMAKDRTVAEGSSVGGTSGLMTVEKQVSINVKRIGTRRFTFTGSINPAHPRATVTLYRNGQVLKAGIPVNSSRVYSFTTTLPAGTYGFRVDSPATGYNNASSSAVRSTRIY